MATISDLGLEKAKITTKHEIRVEVFVDGKKLCFTQNTRDDRKKGGVGIGMEPDVLKKKDRGYVREILVKSLECLLKYNDFMTKTGKFARNIESVNQ